jgi:hypothetical protein
MENKLLNSLILILVISIISLAYYLINQSSQGYFSFTISDVEIGKYSSYKECLEEEASYHEHNLNDQDFEYGLGDCGWRK